MQFRDLGKQYTLLKDEIDTEIQNVMNESHFIMGKQVREIEEELAEYVRTKYCISCANGTDALTLALMVWGISTGDAVFVPDFTFFSTGEVVSAIGATPVFVDVEKDTYNISVKSLEDSIKKVKAEGKLNPKVIIAVDLFGQPADYIELRKIADKYEMRILEDAAQGFGGKINDKKACSFGDISTTSFFPAKPLGCYGDGGAIFTDNSEWAELLKSLRIHGKGSDKYDNVRIGVNSRLDTLQAAVLKVKLRAFRDYELDAVNKVAGWYNEFLENHVVKPVVKGAFYSSWAQYTIQLENTMQREELKHYLKSYGIPTMVYYPKPLHKQGAFAGIPEYVVCTNSEELCESVLSLPMHPYLERKVVEEIAQHINNYITGYRK